MSDLNLAQCPSLSASRVYTTGLLTQARTALAGISADLDDVETVAVGGSLGRLEAHSRSDIDCIVITRNEPSRARADTVIDQICSALTALDLTPPKAWGIYRAPASMASLLDTAALGSLTEAPEIFGKRLQLLLDANSIFRDDAFRNLQARIVAWYGTGFIDAAPDKGWTYLINDVMRYLHAYAAWQQYKVERTTGDSWQLRQAKFRCTRLVTLAGLLVLLGESNAMPEKRAWLVERLPLTPLERLALVMNSYEPPRFVQLLSAYETTHALLSDSASRAELVETGPESIETLCRDPSVLFAQIKQTSGEVIRLLTEFVLARQAQWDPRFFERLIF